MGRLGKCGMHGFVQYLRNTVDYISMGVYRCVLVNRRYQADMYLRCAYTIYIHVHGRGNGSVCREGDSGDKYARVT